MRDRHDHFVKKFSGALDHVEMAVRDRIEAAGVNCAFHFENVQLSTRLRNYGVASLQPSTSKIEASICRIVREDGRLFLPLHDESVRLQEYRGGEHVFAPVRAGAL